MGARGTETFDLLRSEDSDARVMPESEPCDLFGSSE